MTHPVLQGMLMTGCVKQQNILMAFHTYMELCEVKLLWDVDYCFEKELDLIYIKGKAKKNAENFDYYVPVSSTSTITPSWIKRVQTKIGQPDNKPIILVIKDRDSSSVYYNVASGLVPPLSPESAKKKKCVEEKQKYIRSELKKRKAQLFADAKVPSSAETASVDDSGVATADKANDDNDSDDDVIIQETTVIKTDKPEPICIDESDLTNEPIEIIEIF